MSNFKRNISYKVIAILLIAIITSTSLNFVAYADGGYSYLSISRRCKLYLTVNNYHYRKGGAKNYPVNISNGNTIDCSGFVSWTIYEYQEGNFEYRQSKWFLSTAKKLYNGDETDSPEFTRNWTAVKGSENFEPGDILCYPGHVHIYYGVDPKKEDHYLVLNAGSSGALKKVITSISGSYFRRAQYAIRL